MYRNTSLLVVALSVWLSPATLYAQSEGSLDIQGQFKRGDPIDPKTKRLSNVHEVKLSKGKTYIVNASSFVVDTFLRVEDPTGALVAQDDDGGGNLNSRILLMAAKDGTYKITVTTVGATKKRETGSYTLKLVERKAPGNVDGRPSLPVQALDQRRIFLVDKPAIQMHLPIRLTTRTSSRPVSASSREL